MNRPRICSPGSSLASPPVSLMRQYRGVGRHEPDVLFLHQTERGFRQKRAVLDAADAGSHGVRGALVAVRMGFDGHTASSRDFDDGTQLRLIEEIVARIGVGKAGPIGGAGLDDINAVVEVHLGCPSNLLRRLQSARELEQTRVGQHVARAVEMRLQMDAGRHDVGTGEISPFDHLAQRDVGDHRDPGASRGRDP